MLFRPIARCKRKGRYKIETRIFRHRKKFLHAIITNDQFVASMKHGDVGAVGRLARSNKSIERAVPIA